ncbi:MAG: penicillin-binding protein activator LpoB [Myxococcota bacterium]
MRKGLILFAAAALTTTAACGGGKSRRVARVNANSTTDLSGKWNDSDARLTADALIKECFSAAWLQNHMEENGSRPSVAVGRIKNKTDEQIDGQVFVKNIERAMVNSGKVEVLAQRNGELDAVIDEQNLGASGRVSDESAASVGNLKGANYVVVGRIASITDQIEGQATKFYQINFELVNSESGSKVWIGEHKIKKAIAQDKVSW